MFTVDAIEFRRAVLAVEKSREKRSRYGRETLMNIHVRANGAALIVEAADGFRASQSRIEAINDHAADASVIVDGAALVKYARSLKRGTVQLAIVPQEGLGIEGGIIPAIHSHTPYPKIDQVTPDVRDAYQHTIDTAALAGAIAPIIDGAGEGAAVMNLWTAGGAAYAVTSSLAGTDDAPYVAWFGETDAAATGEPVHITTLDARYLRDVLSTVKGTITLAANAMNQAVVVTTDTARHIIMPMVVGAGETHSPTPPAAAHESDCACSDCHPVTAEESAFRTIHAARGRRDGKRAERIANAAPVARFCGQCGTEHEPQDRFCGQCGARIVHESPAQDAPRYGDWEGITDAELDASIANFRARYSAGNVTRILSAMPRATDVRGFAQWLKEGRCVRKGEKGIMIYTPAGNWRDKDGTETGRVRVKRAFVFDITQTDPLTPHAPRRQEVAAYAAD